jgi:hypothetical protein
MSPRLAASTPAAALGKPGLESVKAGDPMSLPPSSIGKFARGIEQAPTNLHGAPASWYIFAVLE